MKLLDFNLTMDVSGEWFQIIGHVHPHTFINEFSDQGIKEWSYWIDSEYDPYEISLYLKDEPLAVLVRGWIEGQEKYIPEYGDTCPCCLNGFIDIKIDGCYCDTIKRPPCASCEHPNLFCQNCRSHFT